jgi:hypothetical protein
VLNNSLSGVSGLSFPLLLVWLLATLPILFTSASLDVRVIAPASKCATYLDSLKSIGTI